jgi:DNA-binding LacI/PurR family transcriptional regulator
MSKRPTIRDVAREAGVAIVTVSDALNGKGRVDPGTRVRIVEIAQRMGYQANRHARGLRSGRSRGLGLVLPVRGDPRIDEALSLDFYMRLASAATISAFSHQQSMTLLPPKLGASELRGLALDGGIVVDPRVRDPHVTLFEEIGLPVVTIDRDLARSDEWYVGCRNDEVGRAILDHLADQGASRIALLLPRYEVAWTAEALGAYDEWVAEKGLPRLVARASLGNSEQSGYEAAARLLARRQPPDAIFVLAARFIRGALRAASEAGRSVPGDLMIASGVDSVHAREGHPPVTAWDLHPERQAEEAVEMLLSRIAGDAQPGPRFVTATPHLRASTGC